MSPLFLQPGGRGPWPPADRVDELRDVAQIIEYYLGNHSDAIGLVEHLALEALRVRLMAYADLLSASEPDRFLRDALAKAGERFAYVKAP